MKIILLQDDKKLGKQGQVIEVNDGFARNYVLPKKVGIEATPKNLNDWKLKKQHEDKVAAEKLAEAKKEAEELKDKFIETTMKVGANGKAFGSVSSKEALGNYKVGIKLHQEVTAEITLRVVEEKQ